MRFSLVGLNVLRYRPRMSFQRRARFHVPLLVLGIALLTGCDQTASLYSCSNPDVGHKDSRGEPDPCHLSPEPPPPPPDAGETCSGECVPLAPAGWSEAMLLWSGPVFAVPECPDRAPSPAYAGFADLVSSGCGECSCEAPSGSCELPTSFTASADTCADDGPGSAHTFFSAPDPWDGSCTDQGAIPAGQLCNGVPCVRSLTIDPLVVNESACTPSQTMVPKSEWQTAAKACKGTAMPPCEDPGMLCVPTDDPPPDGFSLCIYSYKEGEQDCPPAWPTKHVFYEDFDDSPACTPCTCSDPMGGECSGMVSVYQDTSCSVPVFENFFVTSSAPALCLDQPPGVALGSKTITGVSFQPGACAPSGGDPAGDPVPLQPSTFCCR
jgi:hypothetical protein